MCLCCALWATLITLSAHTIGVAEAPLVVVLALLWVSTIVYFICLIIMPQYEPVYSSSPPQLTAVAIKGFKSPHSRCSMLVHGADDVLRSAAIRDCGSTGGKVAASRTPTAFEPFSGGRYIFADHNDGFDTSERVRIPRVAQRLCRCRHPPSTPPPPKLPQTTSLRPILLAAPEISGLRMFEEVRSCRPHPTVTRALPLPS